MPQPRILAVTVMVCVLGLWDLGLLAYRFPRLDAAQTEPASTARQGAAKPDHSLSERFMVRYRGCSLLGPDGEEKEAAWSRSRTGRG